MDEKVLFLVKTPHKCEVKFSVMSLEEPEEANAEGLKLALENSILKLGLNIERKNMEVFLFHFYIMKSVKRNIYIFFFKRSVFLSFNILLPFQPRTFKNSYFNLLNLKQTFSRIEIFLIKYFNKISLASEYYYKLMISQTVTKYNHNQELFIT